MGSKTLRRCSHSSVTEMNFLQTSFMVYLHWSLYEARDREYSMYRSLMKAQNNHLVVQYVCTA
jgi:hypothetical protein